MFVLGETRRALSFDRTELFTPLESLKFDTRAEETVKTFWERGIFRIYAAHTCKPGVPRQLHYLAAMCLILHEFNLISLEIESRKVKILDQTCAN